MQPHVQEAVRRVVAGLGRTRLGRAGWQVDGMRPGADGELGAAEGAARKGWLPLTSSYASLAVLSTARGRSSTRRALGDRRASRTCYMAALFGGAILTGLVNNFIQEVVFTMPGFSFPAFNAMVTSMMFVACAIIEPYFSREESSSSSSPRRHPLAFARERPCDLALLSIMTFLSLYLTNWSLSYINYSSRVIIKSSKLIPTMAIGMLFGTRRPHKLHEYVAAAILTLGIVLFVLGDSSSSPSFDPRGLILISTAVVIDAIVSNYEESRIFKTYKCSPREFMCTTYTFTSLWCLLRCYTNDELFNAMDFAVANPAFLRLTVLYSIVGYVCAKLLLLLIRDFSAPVMEIAKCIRKVLTLLVSLLAFGRPLSYYHIIGLGVFTLSLAMTGLTWRICAKEESQSANSAAVDNDDDDDDDSESDVEMGHTVNQSRPPGGWAEWVRDGLGGQLFHLIYRMKGYAIQRDDDLTAAHIEMTHHPKPDPRDAAVAFASPIAVVAQPFPQPTHTSPQSLVLNHPMHQMHQIPIHPNATSVESAFQHPPPLRGAVLHSPNHAALSTMLPSPDRATVSAMSYHDETTTPPTSPTTTSTPVMSPMVSYELPPPATDHAL